MKTTPKLNKWFVWKKIKMDWNTFINKFISPIEKSYSKKSNLSETHDDYLLKIREWNT